MQRTDIDILPRPIQHRSMRIAFAHQWVGGANFPLVDHRSFARRADLLHQRIQRGLLIAAREHHDQPR